MLARKRLILSVVFVMIASLLTVSIYVIKNRISIYPYEVSDNYDYDFHQSNTDITDLDLKNGKVSLAEHDNINQTAFLKINIDTTFMGKYFQPGIEIIAEKRSLIHHFEHGAKGVRYLNISPLLSKDEAEIRLEGKYVSIADQTVQLLLFKNQDIKKSRILVLAPHPDDAEIAAYGLYSSHKESYIITVTAGDAGANKYDEIYQNKVKQYLKKGELRTWNSITVPLLGGIPLEQSINLGFFDATLESMYKDQSSAVSGLYTHISDIATYRKQNVSSISIGLYGKSDWNSLVGNLEYLLKEIKPDIIVTPYPALDWHKDHKLSSIALFEAIKKSGIKKGKLYLYTNHFVLNEYYPYGNMGEMVSLPPDFKKAIYFDGIYSHPLSIDHQKDKIFALEAMNDLRPDTEWRFPAGAIKMAAFNIKRDIMGEEESYYRRAIRSNELFFVIEIGNIYNKEKLNRIIGIF